MTDQKATPQSSEKIVKKRLDELKPFEKNSRTHSDEQVAQIAASINEWGFTNPVLIDEDGMIIAGHGRVMAAQSMTLATVPCIVAKGWTDEQKRAYVIADNKLALNASWEIDTLRDELSALGELDFDLNLIGFDQKELSGMFDLPEEHFPEEFQGETFENEMILKFDTEMKLQEWYDLATKEGIECKIL